MTDALKDGLSTIASFVPKLLLFLVILVVGYFVAKAIGKALSTILERVGFDRAVERGGVRRVLQQSGYDASDVVGKIIYYALLLFVLQLAFGVFPANPISDLLQSVINFLPLLIVAIIIVVVAAAIAAAVREVIVTTLGGLSYGRAVANAASALILGVGVIAALNQINVATSVTTPILIAVLATIAGILIIGVGGGLVRPMASRWEDYLTRAEAEAPKVREAAQQAPALREQARQARERARAVQDGGTDADNGDGGGGGGSRRGTSGAYRYRPGDDDRPQPDYPNGGYAGQDAGGPPFAGERGGSRSAGRYSGSLDQGFDAQGSPSRGGPPAAEGYGRAPYPEHSRNGGSRGDQSRSGEYAAYPEQTAQYAGGEYEAQAQYPPAQYPLPPAPYPPSEYPAPPYPPEQHQADRYQADQYQADQYQADQYQADQYQADQNRMDQYRSERYQSQRPASGQPRGYSPEQFPSEQDVWAGTGASDDQPAPEATQQFRLDPDSSRQDGDSSGGGYRDGDHQDEPRERRHEDGY